MPSDIVGKTEINNLNQFKSGISATRPTWFLGGEDSSQQQTHKFGTQKKWSVHEGVKMMVTSTFLAGQHDCSKQPSISKVPEERGTTSQLTFNGDTTSARPFGLSSAFAVATSISHIQRYEPPVEKTPPALPKITDSPNSKQLGRQKHVDQPTTMVSPVSPCQAITVTSSDPSSSPAVSSISSQITSTENGQHPSWLGSPQLPMTAPTIERLLPIGTATRPTASRAAQRVLRSEDAYGSPESPLSKMDVLTVSSSFEQDSETCMSSDVTSPRSISQLELPTPERLLPIGPQRDMYRLAERVRQALGVPDIDGR